MTDIAAERLARAIKMSILINERNWLICSFIIIKKLAVFWAANFSYLYPIITLNSPGFVV